MTLIGGAARFPAAECWGSQLQSAGEESAVPLDATIAASLDEEAHSPFSHTPVYKLPPCVAPPGRSEQDLVRRDDAVLAHLDHQLRSLKLG